MPKTKTQAKAVTESKKPKTLLKEKQNKANTKSKMIKKTAPAEGGMKEGRKKPHMRPGTVVLREIKRYQKSMDMLLPRAPFQRVVRNIAEQHDPTMRF